jgi:hypothetical protein
MYNIVIVISTCQMCIFTYVSQETIYLTKTNFQESELNRSRYYIYWLLHLNLTALELTTTFIETCSE